MRVGQVGLNDRKSRNEPNLIVLLDGIPLASVAAGKRHSVALGQDGRIYTWCVCFCLVCICLHLVCLLLEPGLPRFVHNRMSLGKAWCQVLFEPARHLSNKRLAWRLAAACLGLPAAATYPSIS